MSYFKNKHTKQPGQSSTRVVKTYPCKHCDFETEKPLLLGHHMVTEHKDIVSAKRAAKREEKRVKLAPVPPNFLVTGKPYYTPEPPTPYIIITMYKTNTEICNRKTVTFTVSEC